MEKNADGWWSVVGGCWCEILGESFQGIIIGVEEREVQVLLPPSIVVYVMSVRTGTGTGTWGAGSQVGARCGGCPVHVRIL